MENYNSLSLVVDNPPPISGTGLLVERSVRNASARLRLGGNDGRRRGTELRTTPEEQIRQATDLEAVRELAGGLEQTGCGDLVFGFHGTSFL
jgi:hypothetical protein